MSGPLKERTPKEWKPTALITIKNGKVITGSLDGGMIVMVDIINDNPGELSLVPKSCRKVFKS